MAQHYPVTDEKIWRSVRRIAPKVFNDMKYARYEEWAYYNKGVKLLPKEYNPSGFAFVIYPYNMKKVWKDEPSAEENANLEVHLNSSGQVTNIYYPL